MKDIVDIRNQDFSYLGKMSKLKGDIELSGPGHLVGHIVGQVKMLTKDHLTIEREAIIEGSIESFDIVVYGNIIGDIYAKGLVSIYPSAKISGKVVCEDLRIFPGAKCNFDIHCEK